MRITPQAKLATRERIVDAATKLFARQGLEATTTRDIAAAAEIATGTLFNYFESKEAIAADLLSEALGKVQREFEASPAEGPSGGRSLEEDLFAFIYAGLKRLRKFRKALAPALETIFSPLVRSSRQSAGDSIRVSHLEFVERLAIAHGVPGPLPAVTLQLYWTLYLGVFAYWAADHSPNQEDTLALLDHSLKLFVASLESLKGKGSHGCQSA